MSVNTAQNGNATPSPQGLKILIAGAGIGGLYAAISLATSGHNVTVYESSRFALETGAAIHLPPNVNGLLRRQSIIPESIGAVTTEFISQATPSNHLIFRNDFRPLAKVFPFPWQLVHRIDLHNALKDKAKAVGVEIKLQSRVKGVDFGGEGENVRLKLELESGERVEGDLIIGADGVHSVIRNSVLGPDNIIKPFPSGTSAFRFLLPVSVIKSDPITAPFVERPGEMCMVFGNERRLVMYPCRSNTELNFIAMIPDSEVSSSSQASSSSLNRSTWNETASKPLLLKLFSQFAPSIQALLEKVPADGDIKLWKLLDCEPLPTWTRGRVVLLGDAAHPFLPYQGQGGAQAMEDGGALGALLPLGTTVDQIPSRLKLYEQVRMTRATKVQRFTRDSRMRVAGERLPVNDANEEHEQGDEAEKQKRFMGYNFRYDAWNVAEGVLKAELEKEQQPMSSTTAVPLAA